MNNLLKAPVGPWRATVKLPASKSISNRALILNALSYSSYEIENLSDCDDTTALVRVLNSNARDFNVGAAGTTMRFLTAFLSKIVGEWTLTGSERMKRRPIGVLVDALNRVGAEITYLENEGFPPLRIKGHALRGGEIALAGNVSSQYISALLMIAPYTEQGLILRLTGSIISRPYINLTLDLMAQYGVHGTWVDERTIHVGPGEYHPIPFTVESDWSAASYWYALMALSPLAEIELLGLFKRSAQGDSKGAKLFARLGVATDYTKRGVRLRHTGERPRKMVYDFVDQPDLAQTFAVVCALMGIPFRFSGLHSLRIKETDRIAALQTELAKLGYVLHDYEDSVLEWEGERRTVDPSPLIATYEDHRMAMSFALAALTRDDGIRIADPAVVSKSYPHFWDDLRAAGFTIEEEL